MITKQSRITVALLALTAIASVAGLAGQVGKAEPEQTKKAPAPKQPSLLVPAVKQVYLRCSAEKITKTEIVLRIVNSTADTILKGTTIHWQITERVKGSFSLPWDVASGKPFERRVKPTPPGSEFAFNPQPEPPEPFARAWYSKRQFRNQ